LPSRSFLSRKATQPGAKRERRKRSDAGTIIWTVRDEFALTWIGHQYGIRLDHLQWLLGRHPGRGAANTNWISEGAARDVVTRWKRAGWVRTKRIRADEPFWVWLTRLGLRKVGLPYLYRDLEQSSLHDLKHLYAINEIRLHLGEDAEGAQWTSERQLLQGIIRNKDRELLHRPDAQIQYADGAIIAIEAELSVKKPVELAENLMELLRGEIYLSLKAEHGARTARVMSQGYRSQYTEIWYFAPKKVRKQVRRERARLVQRSDLSEEEAKCLVVRWYPLVESDEELAQEEQENDDGFNHNQENIDLKDSDGDENRSFIPHARKE
jgi:hypothetical protein